MKNKKNGFLAKIAWHYLCQEGRKKRAFSCTLSVLAKIFFGPKQCKAGNTIKIGVSTEIAKKQKWHLFWKRVFFDMVENVGFTNCVFEKLCFPENTIFMVFSAKHSFQKQKLYVEKNRNLWKIVGCFWTWQNGVFLGVCFFWGFNIKRFVFGVSGIVSKVLKKPCFSQFWGFSGVAHCCSSGFGRFRCFCVSCVCFSFLCCFCFCIVCFVLGFVVGCCCFVFFCVFVVLFFWRV